MTYKQTSELMSAMCNIEIYAEANSLEYQKEKPDFKTIDTNNDRMNEAKQIIWDMANQQGDYK